MIQKPRKDQGRHVVWQRRTEYNDNIVLIDFATSNLQNTLVPKSIIERYDGEYLYLAIPHDVLSHTDISLKQFKLSLEIGTITLQ